MVIIAGTAINVLSQFLPHFKKSWSLTFPFVKLVLLNLASSYGGVKIN